MGVRWSGLYFETITAILFFFCVCVCLCELRGDFSLFGQRRRSEVGTKVSICGQKLRSHHIVCGDLSES